MSSLNRVHLIGRVGKDPEIKALNSGDRVVNFSIATSDRWKDKQTGERQEKTEWHNVVVFNDGLVKVIEQYVRKGDLIYIAGKLKTRKWTDNSGVDKYSTEVVLEKFGGELVMLSSKGDGEGQGSTAGQQRDSQGGGQRQQERTDTGGSFDADLNDEIPF